MIQTISTRIAHKHDLEVNWLVAVDFVPLQGELIIYDCEVDVDGSILDLPDYRSEPYTYERLKIGDGITAVNSLPFIDETLSVASTKVTHGENLLSDLINTYILGIDYSTLAFDTTEIVVNSTTTNKTSVLGKAILGQMILA